MRTPLRFIVFAAALAGGPLVGAARQNPQGAPPRDAGQKAPVGTSSIAGTVVSDDAKPEPMRRARVTVRSDAYGNGWSATTDDDGRFVIRGVPAGRYSVEVSKPAWLTMSYGATRPGRPGTPIAIADGEQRDNVRLVMTRGAVITGTVIDRSGEPVPGVSVSAMKYAYVDLSGEKSLVSGAPALTDDQGVYRVFGLMPADYVIVATLRSGPSTALMDLRRITADEVSQALASGRAGAAPAAPNRQQPQLVGYAPVYFPGTPDLSRATSVKLAAAEEKGGLNITLDVVPTARIDVVPTVPDNGNRQSLQVYLMARQATPAGAAGMTTGRRDADGHVIFNGVTPGNYTAIARAALTGAAPAPAPGPAGGRGAASALPPLTLYASEDVTVEGRDLVLALDLKPGLTVSGRVTFSNPDRAPKDAAIRVSLVPVKAGPALSVSPAVTDAAGAFQLEGVPAGRYRIDYSAAQSLDSWALVSATLRGRELLDAPLDLTAGSDVADLVLRFTDRPSELAGRLQTSSGQPATAYSIIVFSASRDFWTPMSRRVRSLRPATDGGFSVRGLPAGDYYIAALTDVEPGEWNDPAFLAQLVATSAKIAIRDGEKTVQDLMIK